MAKKIITAEDLKLEKSTGIPTHVKEYVRTQINNFAQYISESITMESALLRVDLYKECENWDKLFMACFVSCQNRYVTPMIVNNAIMEMHETKDKLSEDFIDNHKQFCDVCIQWLEKIRTKPTINKVKCNEIINAITGGSEDDKAVD